MQLREGPVRDIQIAWSVRDFECVGDLEQEQSGVFHILALRPRATDCVCQAAQTARHLHLPPTPWTRYCVQNHDTFSGMQTSTEQWATLT